MPTMMRVHAACMLTPVACTGRAVGDGAEPPKMEFDPKNPMEYIQAQKKGKPAMMFAGLNKIKDPKTGAPRSS